MDHHHKTNEHDAMIAKKRADAVAVIAVVVGVTVCTVSIAGAAAVFFWSTSVTVRSIKLEEKLVPAIVDKSSAPPRKTP